MNKKGFAIIETIIVVVMMTTSLLLVYSTYSASINNEKKRVYYDDVVDLYKVNELKNYLLQNDKVVDYIDNTFSNDATKLSVIIGTDSSLVGERLFDDPTYLQDVYDFYGIDHLIVLKTNYETISSCTYSTIYSGETFPGDATKELCRNSFGNYSYDEVNYIKSLGSNTEFEEGDCIIIAVFTHDDDKYTFAYISWEELV